ncbi:MAG: glycoside hydrolase family 3 protein, partial [Clostridia bacterium]|nr:glycoside hydrolase family 3 protein [Clostridia bacterium]
MYPYQDMALSPLERAKDLTGRMSLEEKAAQTCMLRGVEYAAKPSPLHDCSVEPDTDFYYEKLLEDFGTDGFGFVHDMYATPAAFNRLQRHFMVTSRWGIPAIFTGEALHGITGLRGTVFPVPLGLGATFAPELVERVGGAIGAETRALGMQEILAPNLDVAREPRWGRIEETFGEDTYLSSRMAAAIIRGEQKGDISRPDAVAAEPKHYCVHGIAEGGTNCSHARAGRREVESCYLPVFEAGIREGGAWNVMVSYNSVDGDPLMCSEWYLKDVLKDRFGLKGYSRSDWWGVARLKNAHRVVSTDKDAICLAMNNGLDVQGCDYTPRFWKQTVVELVREGRLPMERLDDIVTRVLRVKFELGLFDRPYTDEAAWERVVRCREHRDLALEAARKSLVLLKNDGVLP